MNNDYPNAEVVGKYSDQTAFTAVPPLVAYWNTLRRRKWIIASIVGVALVVGIILTFLATPLYQAVARIQIEREGERVTNVQQVSEIDAGDDQEFYQTQYALLGARSLAERVVRELNLASNEQFYEMFGRDPVGGNGPANAEARSARLRQASDILLEHVNIEPIRGSSLVDIQFTSPDPALSAEIANTWLEQFMDSTLDRRYASTKDARDFLQDRLAELRRRLETSERDLVGYAARQGIVTLSRGDSGDGNAQPDRTLTSFDLEELNLALAQATNARISAQSALEAQRPGEQTSDTLASLRQARAEATAQLAQLSARFEPEYPEVKAINSKLAALDRSIAQENGRIASGYGQALREATNREQALQQQVRALKNSLVGEQSASIQYNIFQREVDTNRQLYDALLQRYKEIGVSGVASNNVSIVDRALVPRVPSSPNLLLNLLLSLILGLFLALLAVILLEQIDPSDITQRLRLPLLGVIPVVADGDVSTAVADPKSDISEAFLSFQTNLSFLTDHGVPRSILFTSTQPNEGKSNSAVALGRSLARTGKRVLLIDADMRNSSSHELLDVANRRGLSNYLAGEEFGSDLITLTGIERFDLMSAGPQPPNAGELLLSPRLSQLVREACELYDVVLIDAPPVLAIADVPLVAKVAEGVVYTIEMNRARARQIQQSLERITAARGNVFGVLVTKYSSNQTAYGYGYGYGYGRDESAAES